jgi:hypothetical protein
MSEFTLPPEPLSVEESKSELIITWNEASPHRSIFPISWLMDNAYDPEPESLFEADFLWDKAWMEAHPPESYDVCSSAPELWMKQVSTLGFALLRNLELDKLDSFISFIGPVHEFECGRFDTIQPTDKGRDVTYSASRPLLPHTDASHRYDPRLVEFLYCVENQANGGETVILDGFRIAEDFRQHHPEHFQTLAKIPVQFRHYEVQSEYFFCRVTPILELDEKGKVTGIYFSHKNCNRNLPFDQVEKYYEAYSVFFHYLKNPAYQYRFLLRPKDCLVMKNFRLLHGRTAFDANSGSRHLKVGYVGWHYFAGQRNFHRYKHLYLSKELTHPQL